MRNNNHPTVPGLNSEVNNHQKRPAAVPEPVTANPKSKMTTMANDQTVRASITREKAGVQVVRVSSPIPHVAHNPRPPDRR
jgi:hypothetical protein